MTMRKDIGTPACTPKEYETLATLQFLTRNVSTDGFSFAETLVGNVEALRNCATREKTGIIGGEDFHRLFVDALLQSGFPPAAIRQWVNCKDYEAEIDVLIKPSQSEIAYGFHLKTSLRERGRQAERDAIYFDSKQIQPSALELALGPEEAAQYPFIKHYLIMVKEKKTDTPEKACLFARSKCSRYRLLADVISVYDIERMNQLAAQIQPKREYLSTLNPTE